MKIRTGMVSNWTSLRTLIGPVIGAVVLVVSLLGSAMANAGATLQKIDFASLSGDRVEMRLDFDGTPPAPRSYTIADPARITLDLFDVASGLDSKYHSLGNGNARSVTVLEAGGRTRLVVSLTEMVSYATRVEGSSLYVMLGAGSTAFAQEESGAEAVESSSPLIAAAPANVDTSLRGVTGIDFRRGEQGEGRVEIDLSKPDVEIDISQTGSNVRVSFPNASLPAALQRRLDVIDFATPVHFVDALPEGDGSSIMIEASGVYDYLAYQADNKLVIDFKPVDEGDAEKLRKEKFPYSGEQLSLNFQDIEVRSVLQLIADFTNLNLVASDTVDGRITLRLQNVPWDQALDLILKTKGLDKRQIGNVLMVAPADEMANRERLELENSRQVAELAPLQTEFIQVNYAKAVDVAALMSAEQGLLSSRGSVSVDERTNTLLVQDTASKMDAIRSALTYLDVPVRQVQVEARIVVASTDFDKSLGIRWGGSTVGSSGTTVSTASGGGLGDIAVDLGVTGATSAFQIGFVHGNDTLDLTLSALESDGVTEVISQPKIVTADGQTARIESGVEIPYQEASSSGATTVTFKDAVLSLEVTPQITPDDRIIMDLKVNQDSVGELFLGIPSINTRSVETQVLVENGETIVLGGVYERNTVESTDKTPFLGDIPFIGALFKRTTKSDAKDELLIFITPKLIKDTVSLR
ncbi:MAG: type IV pilus secretin PilQ [Pseudomonadales bacterium]